MITISQVFKAVKVIIVKDDEKQELTLKNGSKNVGIKIK